MLDDGNRICSSFIDRAEASRTFWFDIEDLSVMLKARMRPSEEDVRSRRGANGDAVLELLRVSTWL